MSILILFLFLGSLYAFKSKLLLINLISQNPELFTSHTQTSKYYEKDTFLDKLKPETLLNLIHKTYLIQDSTFINELKANNLNSFVSNDKLNIDLNEARIYKQLNQTWYTYCTLNRDKCLLICLKKDSINSFKKHWCQDNRSRRLKRGIYYKNMSKNSLLDEIMNELGHESLKNNFIYVKSLADSLNKAPKLTITSSSYLNQINEGQNDCEKLKCDTNAVCVNSMGNLKCKCKPGYVGHGRPGGCYNGQFCSGRYCRQNGECFYQDYQNGYKCKCNLQCQNGGSCIMTKFKYECLCPRNVTGLLCNETIEYNLFKQKLSEKFQDMNSQDNLKLSDMIKFVETNESSQLLKFYNLTSGNNQFKKFELLDFIKNNLNNKSDVVVTRPNIIMSNDRIRNVLIKMNRPEFYHYHHNYEPHLKHHFFK
ncbi:unnamed protein product [Brachionus calyciflorus]|uniref:EGF-like domain-containing protein n=1 Tax=Brachionus calyciflorus TaxID=104777 RepID=A0A814FYE4_9BILA|nr:unnamed protein product [Brachionus calyciflorus]